MSNWLEDEVFGVGCRRRFPAPCRRRWRRRWRLRMRNSAGGACGEWFPSRRCPAWPDPSASRRAAGLPRAGPARRGRWRRCAARSRAARAGAPATRGRPPRCRPRGSAARALVAARAASRGRLRAAPTHCALRGRNSRTRKIVPAPGRAGGGELAAHQVGEHLGDGEAQAGARRGLGWRCCRARKARRCAPAPRPTMPGPVSSISKTRHLARMAHARSTTWPCAVNLTALPSRLIRICRRRFSSARTTSGNGAFDVEAEGQALGRRLQLEQAARSAARCRAKRIGFAFERELADFDARDVERALDQRQQVVAAAPDDVDRLLAVRRQAGVFVQQLRVAEDAVERRAQLMADRADVAALGAGWPGRPAPWRRSATSLASCSASSVCLCESISRTSRCGLPVRFFLRHLPALVRQHQPPRHDAAHQQQRHVGLDEAERSAVPLRRLASCAAPGGTAREQPPAAAP